MERKVYYSQPLNRFATPYSMTISTFLILFGLVLGSTLAANFSVPASPTQAINFRTSLLAVASSGGDYVIIPNGAEMRILKRNEETGLFYTRWFTSQPCNAVATNGVWFACAAPDALKVFTFDEASSDYGTVLDYAGYYRNIQFLSDGSLVAMNNVSMVTRVNNGDTWDIVDETALNSGPLVEPVGVTMHLTDTNLVYVKDSSLAVFMQRNADYSWTQVDELTLESIPGSFIITILWLNDTLIVDYAFSGAQSNGYNAILQVLVNDNDAWSLVLSTSGEGVIEPVGSLGTSMVPVSNNKVLISAPFDGIDFTKPIIGVGSVVVLERSDSMSWTLTGRILNEPRDRLWGVSVVQTDSEVLVLSCLLDLALSETTCGYSPIPFCVTDPVDVTCSNRQLDSCDDVTNVNLDDLYTIHNSACGATRSASFGFSNSGLEISLDFIRYGVRVGSCNATLTCPKVVVPPSPTPTSNVPNTAPNSSPQTSNVPSNMPNTGPSPMAPQTPVGTPSQSPEVVVPISTASPTTSNVPNTNPAAQRVPIGTSNQSPRSTVSSASTVKEFVLVIISVMIVVWM